MNSIMKQTLTPEQMRNLSELGRSTRNASMCLIRDTEGNRHLSVHDEYCYEASYMNPIPVYTLADIIEMLPKKIMVGKLKYEISIYTIDGKWAVDYYSETDADIQSEECESLIDAVYSRLCWCLENKYIETKEESK